MHALHALVLLSLCSGAAAASRDVVVHCPDHALTTVPFDTPGHARPSPRAHPRHLVYPRQAVRQRAEGLVQVAVIVDADGRIVDARPASADEPALFVDAAVHGALHHLHYERRWYDGRPSCYRLVMPISFTIHDD